MPSPNFRHKLVQKKWGIKVSVYGIQCPNNIAPPCVAGSILNKAWQSIQVMHEDIKQLLSDLRT